MSKKKKTRRVRDLIQHLYGEQERTTQVEAQASYDDYQRYLNIQNRASSSNQARNQSVSFSASVSRLASASRLSSSVEKSTSSSEPRVSSSVERSTSRNTPISYSSAVGPMTSKYSSAVGPTTSKLGCDEQNSSDSDKGFITVPKKKGGVKTTKTSCVPYGGGVPLYHLRAPMMMALAQL